MTQKASQHSAERRSFAQELLQSCPPELGAEVVIIGSVALGTADEHSDIDLCFYVPQLPDSARIMAWLQSLDPAHILPEGQTAFICRLGPFTVEIGWRQTAEVEKLLGTLLAGEDAGRLAGVMARDISRAWVLRSGGLLAAWQQKLASYPDALQKSIITAAAGFWQYPHRVEMLWTLADRQQTFALNTWLMADIEDALRILCAVNRQWEPDWKHLPHLAVELSSKPERLVERVNAIFEQPALHDRTRLALEFVLDVLRLVPPLYDVGRQIENISRSLQEH